MLTQFRTWYGINVLVDVDNRFLHKAGIGRAILPHPALVNLLLRIGLPGGGRLLAQKHEFGHFQTAPGALLYVALVLSLAAQGHFHLTRVFFLLVSTHATWEMASEGYTILADPRGYRAAYAGVSLLPRLFFWVLMSTLTLMGWVLIL
jgi:hypothetical protein